MGTFEAAIAWGATAVYAAASVFFVYSLTFRKTRGRRLALLLGSVGLVLHVAALVLRTVLTGHLPVEGIYENAATAALCIVAPALWVAYRRPTYAMLALSGLPLALFMMGFGLTKYDQGGPLPPPFRSSWLVIHVVFAQLAYGAYALATGAAAVYLLKTRRGTQAREGGWLEKLPSPSNLEDFIFKFVVFGFVTSAMMTIAGAFWADALWGSYWSWDPVETWSLISWMIYGIFIHLRLIHRWEGPRFAWLAIGAMATVVIAYWGADVFSARGHMQRF